MNKNTIIEIKLSVSIPAYRDDMQDMLVDDITTEFALKYLEIEAKEVFRKVSGYTFNDVLASV